MGATIPLNRFRAHIADAMRRVQRGETLIVTKNGRPIAEIRAAARQGRDLRERMKAAGVVMGTGQVKRPRAFVDADRNLVRDLLEERGRDQ